MNRAVHGDVVVAELLDESEWTAPEKTIRLRDAEESQPETKEFLTEGDEEGHFEGADEDIEEEVDESGPAKKARKEVF
jgi:hypothetical protein